MPQKERVEFREARDPCRVFPPSFVLAYGGTFQVGGDTVSGSPRRAGDGCASAIGHFICQGLIGAVPGRTTFQHNSRWCLARTKLHVKEETYATRWNVHSLYMSIARAANNPHVEISMH
jgi:hypothetical protein